MAEQLVIFHPKETETLPIFGGAPLEVSPQPQKKRQRGSMRYGRMNTAVGFLLLSLVILSAVPVGSNRPAWWLVWTLLLGILGMAYVLRAQFLMGKKRVFQVSQYSAILIIALIVPFYAIIQFLPLSGFLPSSLTFLPQNLPAPLVPNSISIMPDASLLGAIRAIGFLVFFILTLEVGTQTDRNRRWGFWLMVGIFFHAVFGMVALKFLDDFSLWGIKDDYIGVLTGTFVNRNSIATFMGFGTILALALALDRIHKSRLAPRDRGHTVILTAQRLEIFGFLLIVAIFAMAIILTQSRMGAFATGMGAYVTFVTMSIATKVGLRKIIWQSATGLAILTIFLIPAAGTAVVERGLFTLIDSDVRLSIYGQTWGMIIDRPWTGFGYDAFAPAFELYRAAPLVEEQYIDLVHNTYLTLWVEQGLVIGSIPMLLIGWAVLTIIKRLRKGEGDLMLNAAALGVVTLSALHSTTDFSLEMPANVFCFLLVLGLAISRPRIDVRTSLPDVTVVK